MDFELIPLTEPGRRFVAIAEAHTADFASRAQQHDRDGTFPFENIEEMKRSKAAVATLPMEMGGLGLVSLHDFTVGISRIGRGDGSTGLAATMHLFRVWALAWSWQLARRANNPTAASDERWLRRVAAGDVIAAVVSEAGTDLLHPLTEAVRVDNGWRLNGRKIFATGSPAAQLLGFACRITDENGHYQNGSGYVASDAPGVEIANNWDALGMRASGSQDVVFRDCFIPDSDLVVRGRWGDFNLGFLAGNLVAVLGQSAVFLGIAEAAHAELIKMAQTRRKGMGGRPLASHCAIQRTVAENEIELAASRAALERTSQADDCMFAEYQDRAVPLERLHRAMKDAQCVKWFVTRHAVEIVDRALTASGGSGYLSKSQLSRLYRDVRAGQFMQPFSPNEAFEYIGKVALGLDPMPEM
jgi:alkylation response protein AidB-like acyl-CoA dehydrogenase